MPKRRKEANEKQEKLFQDLPPTAPPPKSFKPLEHPIWTENKAKLIERYLFYFLMVTKHGTYIDGFAGPQKPNKPQMWAAKLVTELKPQWLRHLYLFEKNRRLCNRLRALKHTHQDLNIQVFQGDFNVLVIRDLLSTGVIGQKEATFCLLDQRTFECHWSTLQRLANYKTNGHKIELFYFFPYFWLDRALYAQKKTDVLDRWWGGHGWREWRKMKPDERKESFVQRFKKELGYQYALAWPIFRRKHGGNIMYYMIHATDHPVAPALMSRAYDKAIEPKEPPEQLDFSSLFNI